MDSSHSFKTGGRGLALGLFAAAATVLGAARTGWAGTTWDEWQRPSLYSATFESYSDGEKLDSTKGTRGGTWGNPPVPAGAKTRAVSLEAGTYMKIETLGEGDPADVGVMFYPKNVGERLLKSLHMNVWLIPNDRLPVDLPGAKSAFAISARKGEEPTFVGWAQSAGSNAWVKLKAENIKPESAGWYELSVKFVESNEGNCRIRYALKGVEGYEPLMTEQGSCWLDAPKGGLGQSISKIGFFGSGGLRNLNGSEPQRGILVGLVPWQSLIINESVYHRGTGTWVVYDSESPHERLDNPPVVGDAYDIDADAWLDDKDDKYFHFYPKSQWTDDVITFEFSLRADMPDYDEEDFTNLCAAVKVVQDKPSAGMDYSEPICRFAYLVDGKMEVCPDLVAELGKTYTLKVVLDKAAGTVSYSIQKGRGAECGPYWPLGSGPVNIADALQTYFQGHGLLYEIKSW